MTHRDETYLLHVAWMLGLELLPKVKNFSQGFADFATGPSQGSFFVFVDGIRFGANGHLQRGLSYPPPLAHSPNPR